MARKQSGAVPTQIFSRQERLEESHIRILCSWRFPQVRSLHFACLTCAQVDHVDSHINAETPGAIHEGGELGYALSVSFGAAMDNPDLIVACVIGDGEAESGPTAT